MQSTTHPYTDQMACCWMWSMQMLCVSPVYGRPAAGRNTPWLDCCDSDQQRSSRSKCCSLEPEGDSVRSSHIHENSTALIVHCSTSISAIIIKNIYLLFFSFILVFAVSFQLGRHCMLMLCEMLPSHGSFASLDWLHFDFHMFLGGINLTSIHVFISSLHDGSVYAGHQPRSYNHAA